MIGKIILFLGLFLVSFVSAKNILIVPANVNYTNEEIKYLSNSIYEFIDASIAKINNENANTTDPIYFKEIVMPIQRDSKKITKFYGKNNRLNFMEKLKNKYQLEYILWYNFSDTNILDKGKIKKTIPLEICLFHKKKTCKNISLRFSNKVFSFSSKSQKDVSDTISSLIVLDND